MQEKEGKHGKKTNLYLKTFKIVTWKSRNIENYWGLETMNLANVMLVECLELQKKICTEQIWNSLFDKKVHQFTSLSDECFQLTANQWKPR